MSLLVRLAASLGVPERLRSTFAWLLAAIGAVIVAALLALAVIVAIGKRERAAVVADRAEADAQASGAVIAADRQAGAAKAGRDRAAQAEQDQLKEKADAAAAAGTSPLDALFGELR